ncbi:hypothetical protein Lser_V15G37374 [Lactuca serriola]
MIVPPINRLKKPKTLVLSGCTSFDNLSKIEQNMEHLVPHNMNHIGLQLISGYLRKLDLNRFNLGDGDIKSAAFWELTNLQELNLERNKFVRLNFSLLQLPRLKYLNIRYCKHLLELAELPLSIAVVVADGCESLESFGDISNCKWLWKVSLIGNHKLGPLAGDIVLNSMLQGNAKDYFFSICLSAIDIWRVFVIWVYWVKTYNMSLPHDWYNHFSGILMFVSCVGNFLDINISIKQGLDENFQSQFWQESNRRHDTQSQETCVGYVSFSSLRHTGCLNSTYNTISFSLNNEYLYGGELRFRVVLVPKDDLMQTAEVKTDWSEFWDEEEVYKRKTFTFHHHPNSSIKIL